MKVTYINHMYLYYNIIIHSLSLSIFQPREILIINTLKYQFGVYGAGCKAKQMVLQC